ncbi:MAG: glycerophosphodiester phosphodiesterase [Candidatus Rokubacteria bacterium]|nr:glycerophosphodiester phosphodiesterase [Candidatus Rokubacteria bacterium]
MTGAAWTGLLVLALALAVTAGRADGGGPAVAAHRGGALLWPENSLLAFRSALALGVDMVETDVHLTADGELVLIHDPTLERTTTGSGPVRSARLADLRTLRLKGADGAATPEPVPALGELLDALAPTRAGLLLEIKTGAEGARYEGIEAKVLALLRARGLVARTIVMAFEPDTLRRVRELAPSVRTALLIGRGRTQRDRVWPAEAVERAREVGAGHLGMNHRLLDADVVAAARRAGITVAAWTVNEEADIRRVVALGVDVVITDRPDLARRVLGR